MERPRHLLHIVRGTSSLLCAGVLVCHGVSAPLCPPRDATHVLDEHLSWRDLSIHCRGFSRFQSANCACLFCSHDLYPRLVPTTCSGTVEHFGGKASATARTWCQVMASGDVLCSWLSYKAIRADGRMQRLAIEGVALYCAGHFGAFLWGHFYNVPMRPYLVVECCVGMPIPAAFWLWARMTGAFRVIKAD